MMDQLKRRGDAFWFVVLTLLAWIHRIAFLLSNKDRAWPFTIFYEGDSETFHLFARSILEGVPYDGGIPFHPPAFPYFLALVHSILGAGPGSGPVPHLAVKLIMALVGSLSVGLIYVIARPYLGKLLALATSILCLYSFGLYVIAVAPVTEGFYLTLLLTTVLLWSRRLSHPLSSIMPTKAGSPSRFIFPGLFLGLLIGLLTLTRAEGLLVGSILWGIGIAGAIKSRSISLRSALTPWILTLVGFLIVLTPWTIRNAKRLSEINRRTAALGMEPLPTFVPITAYGPLNFALANNDEADGTFSRKILPFGDEAVLNLSYAEHRHLFLHGYSVGLHYIVDDPGGFVSLLLRKWGIFFEAWKLGWTQWNFPGGLDGLRRPVDIFVPHSYAALLLQVSFAVLGMVLLLSAPGGTRRWGWIVLIFTLSGMLTTGLFFGYARQGVLLLPLWLSLVATGVLWVVGRVATLGGASLAGEPSGRVLRIVAVGALVLLALEAFGATQNRDYRATGTSRPGEQYLIRDDVIYLEPFREEDGGAQ